MCGLLVPRTCLIWDTPRRSRLMNQVRSMNNLQIHPLLSIFRKSVSAGVHFLKPHELQSILKTVGQIKDGYRVLYRDHIVAPAPFIGSMSYGLMKNVDRRSGNRNSNHILRVRSSQTWDAYGSILGIAMMVLGRCLVRYLDLIQMI